MAKLLAVLLIMLLVALPALSKDGTVRGSVKNAQTGELLPMSHIFFYSMNSHAKPKFIRTTSGNFTILEIPPGAYSFFISCDGYRPLVAQQLEVKAGAMTEVNFVLQQELSRTDSTDIFQMGKPGVDYKMQYVKPNLQKYR
jgi:hypothetical protein